MEKLYLFLLFIQIIALPILAAWAVYALVGYRRACRDAVAGLSDLLDLYNSGDRLDNGEYKSDAGQNGHDDR